MTELKEELKPRTGEDALSYAKRTREALERHNRETGEILYPTGMLPGEGPGETLIRVRLLNEADVIEAAGRERRRAKGTLASTKDDTSQERKDGMTQESRRSYRAKSQERDVERAVSEFEEARQRLYRRDGTQVYGEAEHAERLGKLTEGLREKVGAVVAEAEQDAAAYEREALGLSYRDPTAGLTTSERDRLSASFPLVREDCQTMPLPALAERLKAVAAGSDKVPKILHARYSHSRAEAEDRRLEDLARDGGSVSPEDARALRELRSAVSELERQIEDQDIVQRREAAIEAAKSTRSLATKLRRRRSEADGSDERAREEYREYMRSTI